MSLIFYTYFLFPETWLTIGLFQVLPVKPTSTHQRPNHGQEEGFHDPGEEEEAEDSAAEEGGGGAEEGAGAESGGAPARDRPAVRQQGRHRRWLHGRSQEDLHELLRQVVRAGGGDVLPAARGHPP